MKFLSISHIRLVLAAAIAAVTTACAEDPELFSQTAADDTCAGTITFRCSDMLEVYKGPGNVASRAADLGKNGDEQKINTLHVFFFEYIGSTERGGKLLTAVNYDNFGSYIKTDKPIIDIPSSDPNDLFEDMSGTRVFVVALANIDATDDADSATDAANMFRTLKGDGSVQTDGRIQRASRAKGGEAMTVSSYEDLEKWVYYPRIRMSEDGVHGDISKLPEAGMPMIGSGVVDFNDERPIISMAALMAKVNVCVTLNPDDGYFVDELGLPELHITEYGVRNMPIAVPFSQPKGIERAGATSEEEQGSFGYYMDMYEVTQESMFHIGGSNNNADHIACKPVEHEFTTLTDVTINKDSPDETATFTYYTFENINLPNYFAKRAGSEDPVYKDGAFNYPPGVKAEDYQRWKSTLAYDYRASALVLKGEFRTHQNLSYKAQFTVYLGNDPVSDFQVKRNHKYDNNIRIKGLDYVRNSSDNVYTFDGRVNVVSENPLYLSIVNERRVDAHATALPMDIWIDKSETAEVDSEVKIYVEDPETDWWIRMEYVSPETMAAGRVMNGVQTPYAPGTGIRPYFTYDLVTNTLANSHNIIVPKGDNRGRIYFYIDENVPTDANGNGYGPRSAAINIEYDVKYNDGTIEKRYRTLDIDQAALVKVEGAHPSRYIPITWMEYYEEYLDHSDPLDPHNQPGELYDGLPWGLRGNRIGQLTTYTPIYTKTDAFSMTQDVVNRLNIPISTVYLYNDNEPGSAFHYCYGKNKRNSDGSVHLDATNRGWYLPGLSELELAMTDYYTDFDSFKETLYWSASPSEERTLWPYNGDSNHARATGVYFKDDGTPDYYVSASSGNDGYQDRNSIHRIRAFYRYN